jgi:hypothetical protein
MTYQQFQSAHPVEFQWINENALAFDFARSLNNSLVRYGSLTEKQIQAVRKCINAKADAKKRAETAQSVDVSAIQDAFNRALSSGVKRPRLRLDTFTFSLAPLTGKNSGALYVKEGEQYLGKVLAGKFLRVRDCDDRTEKRVVDCAVDPHNSAIAYGKKFGVCSACGLTLSREDSIARSMGAICAKRYGW